MNSDDHTNEFDQDPASEPTRPGPATTPGEAGAAGDHGPEEAVPAPGPVGPPPRRLLRYPEAGPGAGVAAGLGAYFGVDPVLFRIAFVLLAFAGGSGILLYVLGWILIPEAAAGEQPAPATGPPDERTRQMIGVGLVVIALLWLTSQFDLVSPSVFWAIGLIVAGVLLFRGDLGRSWSRSDEELAAAQATAGTAGAAPASRPPSAAYASSSAPPSGGWGAGSPPPPPRWTPPPAPPSAPTPATRQEPASVLGRLTLGLALLAIGLAALLDTADIVDVSFRHYVSLTLLVVGLGLLVGAWWGRARGLIGFGLVLLPVLVLASIVGSVWNVSGEVGERFYTPTSVTEVRDRYEVFAGRLELDLTELDLGDETVDVRASVNFGELVVRLPADVEATISARAGAGEVSLPQGASGDGGQTLTNGLRVERSVTLEGTPGGGSLDLDLGAGFGTVTVQRDE